MSTHLDSLTGQQWHVRYRVTAHGPKANPFWSSVYDDEAAARETLARYARQDGLADVHLKVRDVSPWRDA